MKVKELIELLKTCNPEEIVIMSKDSEGNRFSPFCDLGRSIYRPDTTYSGSLVEYARNRQEGDIDAVTLWPIN